MALRNPEDKDFVGKTVKSIVHQSVNALTLEFTDGTSAELWAEQAVMTQFGAIPGIFVEDEK